jgi:hypothetical protein
MNPRSIFSVSAMTVLGLALVPSGAVAQQTTLKEQLVGTWTLILKQITGFAEGGLAHPLEQVGTIDPRIIATIFIVLIVFAAVSRRLLIFLAATLSASVGCMILLVPSSATSIVAIGASLGSLLITVAGMRSRRREMNERQNFDRLSGSVQQLELAEQRRLLRSLATSPRSS